MLCDAGGSLWGALVFSIALLTPGYAFAHWMLGSSFRTRSRREQLAWSVALSFGVSTITIVALTWLCGVSFTGWLLVIGALATIFFARRNHAGIEPFDRDWRRFAFVATFWTVFVILSLTDLGVHARLWMSVTSYDHSVRTAFVGAVMRGGVPPANPLYWPGHDAPMRYYYFWYVLCGVIAHVAHISARQALIASCVWPLAGVAAMLALFARHLLDFSAQHLRKIWWLALVLLTVTGLDLLPNIAALATGDTLNPDMEWWSVDQITSWVDTFLWVPHHAAALVCSLLALLLLWLGSREAHAPTRRRYAIVAGLSFASAFGLSTYVAAGTAIIALVWFLFELPHANRMRSAASITLASCIAAVVLLPYLLQLSHPSADKTSGAGSVLAFGVRRIIDPALLAQAPVFAALRVHHPFAESQLAAALLLLPGYFTELGLFGIVLVLCSRNRKQRSPGERTLLLWTWTGLAAVTLIRSNVLSSNDFAFRASLLPQFFLLLLAAITWQQATKTTRRWLVGFAVIGILGGAWQVLVLRAYIPWHEHRNFPPTQDLAEQNYALRNAFHALDPLVPANARVQYNPSTRQYWMFAQMLQANRQIVNADPTCSTSFGGETSACVPMQQAIATLYNHPNTSSSQAAQSCTQLGAQYLIATRWDAIWSQSQSWVWTLPVILNQPNVRVVDCRATAAS